MLNKTLTGDSGVEERAIRTLSEHSAEVNDEKPAMQINRVRALIFSQLAGFTQIGYRAFLKYMIVEHGIAPLDPIIVRLIILILVSAAAISIKKIPFSVAKQDRWLITLNGFLSVLYLGALNFILPFAKITVITAVLATSLFWASTLGWMINGDRMVAIEIISIFCCFGGVILVCMTDLLNETDIDELENIAATTYVLSTTAAILVTIPLAIAYGAGAVIMRKLQHVNNLILLLYYGLIAFAVVGFAAVIQTFATG